MVLVFFLYPNRWSYVHSTNAHTDMPEGGKYGLGQRKTSLHTRQKIFDSVIQFFNVILFTHLQYGQ